MFISNILFLIKSTKTKRNQT